MSTGSSPGKMPEENGSKPSAFVFLERGSWKPIEEKKFREFLNMETDSHDDPEKALDGDEPILTIGRMTGGTNEYDFVGSTRDVTGLRERFEYVAAEFGYEENDLRFAYP